MNLFLLLDYDGTLTPIVKRPEKAILSRKRREILRQIAHHPSIKMAIISGRQLSDIKKLIAIPHIIYVGNHGFEIEIQGKHQIHPAAKYFVHILKKIKNKLARKIKIKGVLIEDKEFTLSIHYRLVSRQDLQSFHQLFSTIIESWKKKIRITTGKKVIEIRPPFDWDKGKAVRWIISKLKLKSYFPVYIGDDRTDEDAFRVLKGKGISAKVGMSGKTLADRRLKNVAEVYRFLSRLV